MNKSVRSFKSGAQAGFTLIELVVVIVILGILAATAIPKFIDMSTNARTSKMQAAAGSIKAGAALYHAQWLASGSPVDGSTILMEGQAIAGVGGYPAASATGIQLAAGLSATDYQINTTSGFVVAPDSTHTACAVTYTAAAAGAAATTVFTPTNC